MKKILIEQQNKAQKTKDFQDWMDINHPNWVGCTDNACTNGRNLNKGNGYGNFGESTTKSWNLYGNDFNAQYNPQSSGGNAQQIVAVDKAKEIFDKFNESVNFLSVNNEKINLEYNQQVSNKIKHFLSKKYNCHLAIHFY